MSLWLVFRVEEGAIAGVKEQNIVSGLVIGLGKGKRLLVISSRF